MIVGNILSLDIEQLREGLQIGKRDVDPISAMEYMQETKGQVTLYVYVEYAWTFTEYNEPVWEINAVELTFDVPGISHPNIYRLTADEIKQLESLINNEE